MRFLEDVFLQVFHQLKLSSSNGVGKGQLHRSVKADLLDTIRTTYLVAIDYLIYSIDS